MKRLNDMIFIPRITTPCFSEGLARLALGSLGFGWYLSRQQSFAIMDAYWESGGNLIDTSDNYSNWAKGNSGGESEIIIGEWIKDRKPNPSVRIATKTGYETDIGSGLSRNHILKSAKASLSRLGVHRIDLYQLNFQKTQIPVEETLSALKELQQSGDIDAVGFCNIRSDLLRSYLNIARKMGLERIVAYQGKLNYLERDRVSKELFRIVQDHNLVFMAYGIMARGFLSGKYKPQFDPAVSFRAQSVYKKYYHNHYQDQLKKFLTYAASLQKSPSQTAYYWVQRELERQKGLKFLMIGGFTDPGQMQQCLKVLKPINSEHTETV